MSTGMYALLAAVCAGVAVGFGSIPALRLVDRLNRTYRNDLFERMTRSGMDTSNLDWALRWRILGGIVAWLVLWILFGMFPVGLMVGALVYVFIPAMLEKAVIKHRTLLRDQLVTAVRKLAGRLRGSGNLVNGFAEVAHDTPAPLGDLLSEAVMRAEVGLDDLPDVLTNLKDRLQMDTVSLFVVALSTAHKRGGGGQGGGFSQVLDAIGNTLQETQRAERKREADTAGGRLLVNVLVAFPFFFMGLFYMLDPEATEKLFSTLLGQLVLCAVGALSYLALWIARKILGIAEV